MVQISRQGAGTDPKRETFGSGRQGPGDRQVDQIGIETGRFRGKGGGPKRAPGLPLHGQSERYILNLMVQYARARLDASFAALADATRRGVLEQLGRGNASITDLADKFHMTLTGMKKHVGVLERAGLVTTEKVGRVRTCKLGLRGLEEEAAWIVRYRQLWDARFDELDKVVEELKRKEKVDGRKKRE
jgi:DNA-binding transcriptional ArsR family regulator